MCYRGRGDAGSPIWMKWISAGGPLKKQGKGILDICDVYVEMVQDLKARGYKKTPALVK